MATRQEPWLEQATWEMAGINDSLYIYVSPSTSAVLGYTVSDTQ
jgi:hypothetical protein